MRRLDPIVRLRRAGGRALARFVERADVEDRLVWLLGSPRTGSTWLLSLLDGHERVVPVDEPGIGAHLSPFLPDLMGAPAATFPPERMLFNEARAGSPHYFFADEYKDVWRPELRRLLLARFGAHLDRAGGQDRLAVIKEPNGSQAAELLLSVLPRSRVVFVLRDARDVFDSQLDAAGRDAWRAAYGGGQDMSTDERLRFLEERARRWLHRTEVVQRAFDRHDLALRLTLRYEDLLADTREELGRLYRWLGLDTSSDALDAIIAPRAFEALPEEQRGSGQFARAAQPGLWRQNLSEAEQRLADQLVGDKLRELGYD